MGCIEEHGVKEQFRRRRAAVCQIFDGEVMKLLEFSFLWLSLLLDALLLVEKYKNRMSSKIKGKLLIMEVSFFLHWSNMLWKARITLSRSDECLLSLWVKRCFVKQEEVTSFLVSLTYSNVSKISLSFQICSLLRGGIAERGGVRVGHRIIEINGQSVVAVPHERIVNLLATSVGEVSL